MSRLPFELFLALRYLRPKRTFVSVITLISVLGVTLGVWALIVVISVMTGFDQQLREKLLGFSAHLKISKYDAAIPDYESLAGVVGSNKNVTAVAPFILGQVMLKTQPTVGKPMFSAPWLRGIDPAKEKGMTSLATNIIAGNFNLEEETLLVGSEIAHNLRLNVGDRVAIYSPRSVDEMEQVLREVKEGKRKELDEFALPEDYRIAGIFDVGYYEFNANIIATSLRNAQNLYELPGKVHALIVTLRDPYLAGQVRNELSQVLGDEYRLSTWTDENSQILTALSVEKNVMFIIILIVMVVAAFGIAGTLIAYVVHKTREIGILKAIGAKNSQVMMLFLGQSMFVGLFGIASGFILAMTALAYRNEFLHLMNRWTGLELFPASIYAFTELPARILPSDILMICGSALAMCILAGVIPSFLAATLKPVEALRHE